MSIVDLGSFKQKAEPVSKSEKPVSSPDVSDERKYRFLVALTHFEDGSHDLEYLRRLTFVDEAVNSGNFQKWSTDARDLILFSGALYNQETLFDYAKEIIRACTFRDHTGSCFINFEPYREIIEQFAPGAMPPKPDAEVVTLSSRRKPGASLSAPA
ncbi:MAG: hypothetical protein AAF988_04070 [Pseudomonadota bacterium]